MAAPRKSTATRDRETAEFINRIAALEQDLIIARGERDTARAECSRKEQLLVTTQLFLKKYKAQAQAAQPAQAAKPDSRWRPAYRDRCLAYEAAIGCRPTCSAELVAWERSFEV